MELFKSIILTAGTFAVTSSAIASIEIATSYVGDVGNSADSTGYGAVDYGYHIGTYEVTNSQYVEFLNAKAQTDTHGLYNSSMLHYDGGIGRTGTSGSYAYNVTTGMGSKPVLYNTVAFPTAARFANWLTNGQGAGDTETGVYNLTADGIANNTVTRDAGEWNSGGVAVSSEDEWYKAAYYQPVSDGGDVDSYWLYPTASNSMATSDANYSGVGLTDAGTYSHAASYYGTFDQGGNVWELNDTIIDASRGNRGGSFITSTGDMQPHVRGVDGPLYIDLKIGFRVSSLAPIPEPSTYAAIFGSLALTVAFVRRKGRGARL